MSLRPPSDIADAEERCALLRAITDSTLVMLFVMDLERKRNVYSNRELWRGLGYDADELRGLGDVMADLIHPDDLERAAEHLLGFADAPDGAVRDCEYRIRHRSGEYRWFRARATPYRRDPASGRVVQVLGSVEDVTERRAEAEARDRALDELARSVAMMKRHHAQHEIIGEMNDYLQSAVTEDEVYEVARGYLGRLFPTGSGFVALVPPSRDKLEVVVEWGDAAEVQLGEPEACWAIRRSRVHVAEPSDMPVYCPHHDGVRGQRTVCVPMQWQGDSLGVFGIALAPGDAEVLDNVTGLAKHLADALEVAITNLRLRGKLRDQAIRDPVTGLYNRRYMEESLQREVSRAQRAQQPLSVLVADLDHFKRYNDRAGHAAGDRMLQAVAHRLEDTVRDADIVCRYGGEEFVLVLPDCGAADALARAEELREQVRRLPPPDPKNGETVTISIGVSTLQDQPWTGDDLFRAADLALYAAKHAGRNRVHAWDPELTMRSARRSSLPPPAR